MNLKPNSGSFKKGHASFNKGKKFSTETKEKMRIAATGRTHSQATKEKISLVKKKNPQRFWLGIRRPNLMTEEVRKKISVANKGKKKSVTYSGPLNHSWIADRSKLAKKQLRNDPAYKEWRKQVWLRDNFKCKLANPGCSGKIEAHHILGWSEFIELRYEINNGITLCHAHHPRKRAEEKRMIPIFQELLSVSNE